jgi:hypothetical protein
MAGVQGRISGLPVEVAFSGDLGRQTRVRPLLEAAAVAAAGQATGPRRRKAPSLHLLNFPRTPVPLFPSVSLSVSRCGPLQSLCLSIHSCNQVPLPFPRGASRPPSSSARAPEPRQSLSRQLNLATTHHHHHHHHPSNPSNLLLALTTDRLHVPSLALPLPDLTLSRKSCSDGPGLLYVGLY